MMAEKENGLIEGVLGAGESEERESEETNSRSESEATAVATIVAMDAARYDPELARKAGEYLEKQNNLVLASTELVKLQVHHFDEERKLAIDAAKRKRFFDHLRMSFQVFLTTIAAGIGLGALFIVHGAITSRSVVIEPFDTPHALVERGITGKTVSAGLLDVLSKIQVASRNTAESRSLSNAWTNDIAIEVPETGLSIGQIERALKDRFGHDQHIDGDLVQTETGGLALTVRGNGILAKTFSDDTRDLDKLLVEAGEYVYSQSQPGIWMAYLVNNNRADDAIRFAQETYAGTDPGDKPYILRSWASSIITKGGPGAAGQALPLLREAVRLQPDYWRGYTNQMSVLESSGDEEGAVHVYEQLTRAAGGQTPEIGRLNYAFITLDLQPVHAWFVSDMELHGGVGTQLSGFGAENLIAAQTEALLHDVEGAAWRLQSLPLDEKNISDVSVAALTNALLAEEAGDLNAATKEWDVFASAYKNPTVATLNPQFICYAAPSYEKAGQSAKANAALDAPMKAVGYSTFVDCYRFKGDVLELRGDWTGAQQWYAKAIKLAPSIPTGYYSYGMALLKHGELSGAAEQFKLANQKGPHWADPLKAWGDVLIKQSHKSEAVEKYEEAAKYAPKWKQLKEAREMAAKVAG